MHHASILIYELRRRRHHRLDNETDDVPGALTQAWVDAIREIQCELWWSDDNFLLPTHQCAMDQITRSVSLCEVMCTV